MDKDNEMGLIAQVFLTTNPEQAAHFFNTVAAMRLQLRNVYSAAPCQELWQLNMMKALNENGKDFIRELGRELDHLEGR
ncbi:hypothetical protein LCGC14_1037270 [marine sediment metagenome]|uniref:Uncharacterized protein n=1 Tax=marine sediment metagenome TaxID=412755 RepID=A0A0F9QB37_9ZZZZ